MKTQIKIFVGIAASVAFFINSATAQEYSRVETLEAALRRSVCERIGGPLVFSTRDSLFALSLPTDEPATVYLQLTVGRNGKIKEKQTKVHANHLAQYVAPAFVEAAKGLRVDRELLARMQNKDTSLLVEFSMEYVCAYDTVSRSWPVVGDLSDRMATPFYSVSYNKLLRPLTIEEREKVVTNRIMGYWRTIYSKREFTRIWCYWVFIKEQ